MAEAIEMTPDECGGYHCTRDEHVDCLEGMRRQRDDLSDEMERCHEMLNRRDGIEPGWTSMETLEDRLKTLLDESAEAARAEREARERAEGEAALAGDALQDIWRPRKGCGDHSCVCGPPTGQATNGGCRCEAEHLRSAVAELRVKARGALIILGKFKG